MNYKKSLIVAALASTMLPVMAQDDSTTKNNVRVDQLSLASAVQAAQISINTCREAGAKVSAAVVDRNGLTQVILRDTFSSQISVELSRKKAFTAANFSKNTTQLANLSDTAVGRTDGVLMSAGGVLIKLDDTIYGAIGVSGAETGAIDDNCAKAGAKAITDAITADKALALELEAAKEKETGEKAAEGETQKP